MKKPHYDSVIVGGGIIGLFTAWELIKAGQSVCVVDRGEMGRGASWAAGGILSPLRPWKYPKPVNDLSFASQQQYPDICEELHTTTGIDPEWRQTGMLILDSTELTEATDWGRGYQIELQALGRADIHRLCPQIRLSGGTERLNALWLPGVAQVRNPRLLKALVAYLRKRGVAFLPNTQITSVQVVSGSVKAVCSSSAEISCDQVVVAAGAWSAALLPGQGAWQTLRPVKGQMLLYPRIKQPLSTMLFQGDRYLIPRADGRLLVGSSVEHADYDAMPTQAMASELGAFAASLLPELQDIVPEHHWAGLRPATQDEVPLVGPHPDIRGLYMNIGHYRSGVIMAPASAQALVRTMS